MTMRAIGRVMSHSSNASTGHTISRSPSGSCNGLRPSMAEYARRSLGCIVAPALVLAKPCDGLICSARANCTLFRLDVGRLDDGPPFLDLGLVKRAESLRRLLLARRGV